MPPSELQGLPDAAAEAAAIRHERDRANGYLELFPHVLVSLDREQRISAVNAPGCAVFGQTEGALLGRDFIEVAVSADDAPRVRRLLAHAVRGDGPHRTQFTCRAPGTPPRTLAWRCIGVDDDTLCAGEDVTDALQREADAAEAQARLTNVARFATMGELAAGIAHEVNQPLAAITNYARAGQRFLARAEPDVAEAKLALDEIASEALRAGSIIQRLRRLIDGQRGERQATDVNELVEELQLLTGADARAHGTRLRFDLERPLPAVCIDPAELQHVLLNLARNALEALSMDPVADREVHITTRRAADGTVEISVCDNGPGVSDEILARMFDPFSTSKPSGTGLGLAVGRSLVKSMGGRLDYAPVEPRGARFSIHLPVDEERIA